MPPSPLAVLAWLSTLAYAVGAVILVAGTFSLAQCLLARLYRETLGAIPDGGDPAPPQDRASAARSGR